MLHFSGTFVKIEHVGEKENLFSKKRGCLEASSCFSAYVGHGVDTLLLFPQTLHTAECLWGAHSFAETFCNRCSANEADTEVSNDTKIKLGRRTKGPLVFFWSRCLSHVIIVIVRYIIKLVTYCSPERLLPKICFAFNVILG